MKPRGWSRIRGQDLQTLTTFVLIARLGSSYLPLKLTYLLSLKMRVSSDIIEGGLNERTQDAHDILAPTDLCSQSLITFSQGFGFYVEDFDRGISKNIHNVPYIVNVFPRDNIDHEAPEFSASNFGQGREQIGC